MKRFFAVLLLFAMCFSLALPAGAYASGSQPQDSTPVEVTTESSEVTDTTPAPQDAIVENESQTIEPSTGDPDSEAAPPTETTQPEADPSESEGDTSSDESSSKKSVTLESGEAAIDYIMGSSDELKLTFSLPVTKLAVKSAFGEDSYTSLALTEEAGKVQAAFVDGKVITFNNDWLATLGEGMYTLRFDFGEDVESYTLTLTVMLDSEDDLLPPEDEIGEDGLTDEERENITRVQGLIDELPDVSDVEGLPIRDQNEIYDKTQAAYTEYEALSELEQMLVDIAKIEELFGFFNSQIMPISNAYKIALDAWNYHVNFVYRMRVGDGRVIDMTVNSENVNIHFINGKPVYCLMPAQAFDDEYGYYYTSYSNFWSKWLTGTQRTQIRRILAYGYPACESREKFGHSHSRNTCMGATQVAIWEVTSGALSSNYGHNKSWYWNAIKSDYKNKMKEIYALCQNHSGLPSWLYPNVGDANIRTVHMEYNAESNVYEAVTMDEQGENILYTGLKDTHGWNTSYESAEWLRKQFVYPDQLPDVYPWAQDGWTFTLEGDTLHITATVEAICDVEHSVFDAEKGTYLFTYDKIETYTPSTEPSVDLYLSNYTGDMPSGYPPDPSLFHERQVCGANANGNVIPDPIPGVMVIEGMPKFPIEITKKGDTFVDASAIDNGSGYEIAWDELNKPDAVYDIYAAEDILSKDGKITWHHAGDLVVDGITTDEDGIIRTEPLFIGKYRVVERKAPHGYVVHEDEREIIVDMKWPDEYGPGEPIVTLYEVTFTNEEAKASVRVLKHDDETEHPVIGAIFGLYAAEDILDNSGNIVIPQDALIIKATSDKDGYANFDVRLPYDFDYYVKEIQGPKGYLLNEDARYDFTFDYIDDNEDNEVQFFEETFKNEKAWGEVSFIKEDEETQDDPQGDATFVGAVYGLYAREPIIHPDGFTNNPTQGANIQEKAPGLLYEKDELVAQVSTTVNPDGSVGGKFEHLFPGLYYIKEITAPEGYTLSPNEYDVDLSYKDDHTPLLTVPTVTVTDTPIKQVFRLIKTEEDAEGNDTSIKLAGAGFSAWLISDLKAAGYVDDDGNAYIPEKNPDGSWPVEPIVLGPDGEKEVFSDDEGYVETIGIPYGVYIFKETTVPRNFTAINDITVTIPTYAVGEADTQQGHDYPAPQYWGVAPDAPFKALLRVFKYDGESNKPVLKEGAKYRIYNIEEEEYVEQYIPYTDTWLGTEDNPYAVNEDGWFLLNDVLQVGHYRIIEVGVPDGYVTNKDGVEVYVSTDTAYRWNVNAKAFEIEVHFPNDRVKGKLEITKMGEAPADFGSDFDYEMVPLDGAEFGIYAAEDIYTPDMQTISSGERTLATFNDTVLVEGALAATITTDAEGKASLEGLPLGKYKVVETKAPEGYVLTPNDEEFVTFTWVDGDTPVVEVPLSLSNTRQLVDLMAIKVDAETEIGVEGAVFGLYAAENVYNVAYNRDISGADIVVEQDAELARSTTDADGVAAFEIDLPLGKYYIEEVEAPDGYIPTKEDSIPDNDRIEIDASYRGQDIPVIKMEPEVPDRPTKVQLKKTDATTGVELNGAHLYVIDKNGDVVDEWVSVAGEEHIIRGLTIGDEYTLREEIAPYGYLKATDVKFTVQNTEDIQPVEMKDEVPTARLLIDKDGEFLESVSLTKTIEGWLRYLFNWVSGSLNDVTFEVYAAEDIKAADGVSENYFNKGDLIATITTGKNGIAELTEVECKGETIGLPLGRYMVVEKETDAGHFLDTEPRYIDLLYIDQDTPVVTYTEAWQNARKKLELNIVKVDADHIEKRLSGAVFGLYTVDDIIGKDGSVLLEAGTLIEERGTDSNGTLTFTAEVPVGYTYQVKELVPPLGYVTNPNAQSFEFTGSEPTEVTKFTMTFTDEVTKVTVSKKDITNSEELPGADLEIRDKDGNVVDSWTSGEETHYVEGLHVGETYTLTETRPADGYATAETVEFTIQDTAEIQPVEMFDQPTQVSVSKKNVAGDEIPGASMQVTDKDGNIIDEWTSGEEAHIIEKLVVGETYTLHEDLAPLGYATASDVEFTIEDTGEVQPVEMIDELTKVSVSKKNVAGDELPGAKLQVKDKDGNIVDEWTSGKEAHIIEGLHVGETYTLHEDLAPLGYAKASDVEFTIEDTGEIQMVEMVDELLPSDTPRTGDRGNLLGLIATGAFLLMAAAGSGYGIYRKKRNYR